MPNEYKVYAGPAARSDISDLSVPTESKFNAGLPIYASQVGAIERQNALLLNAICATIAWSPDMDASAADNASSFLTALKAYLVGNDGVDLQKTANPSAGDLLKIKSGSNASDGINVTNAESAYKYYDGANYKTIGGTLLKSAYFSDGHSITFTPSNYSYTFYGIKGDSAETPDISQTVTVNMPGIKIENSTLYITKTNVD